MRVPPQRPNQGTAPLSFESQSRTPALDLRVNQPAATDNTGRAPYVSFERVSLSSLQPTARTQVSFVEGHAPLTLELTKAEQAQLQGLIQRFPKLRPELEKLASQHTQGTPRLLSRDKNGGSLLEQLHRLSSSTSKLKQVDTAKVLGELVTRLADRKAIFQGPQFTCGSAALQNWLHKDEPGELARITTDLALSGKSRLRDGSSIALPPDFDSYLAKRGEYVFNGGKDKDVRALSDALFQSAVMQDISLVGGNRAWKGKSDNLFEAGMQKLAWITDWAGYDPEGDDVGFAARAKGNGGGDPYLLSGVMRAISGKDFPVTSSLIDGAKALQRELAQAHAEGRELIALYKSPLHYVLVKDYDPVAGKVTCLSTGTYASSDEVYSLKDFLANCGALIGR